LARSVCGGGRYPGYRNHTGIDGGHELHAAVPANGRKTGNDSENCSGNAHGWRFRAVRKSAGRLSEKVLDEDDTVEKTLNDLHHEFKRQNAYSDLEISRKRAALDNVLIPETLAAHLQRIRHAGFSHAGVWLRYFNFISIIAIR